MKKKINKPMRAAGILLVATMLTTCMTAGTFAKYTTSDSATDTARVAKFGVNINVNGTLFGKEYAAVGNQDSSNKPIAYTSLVANDGTVQAYSSTGELQAGTDSVVAPGTENSTGLAYNITGKPEVDSVVNIKLEGKNVYLTPNEYGIMTTMVISNQEELNAAIAAGNLYYISAGDATASYKWTKVADNATFDNSTIYCKYKDVISSTDFGTDNYFPVVYDLAGTDSGNNHSVSNTGTYNADSLKAAFDKITDTSTNVAIQSSTQNVDSANKTGYTRESLTSKNMFANYDYSAYSPIEKLTWKWTFHRADDGTASDTAVTSKFDKMDTILGDLVAQDSLTGDNTDETFTENLVNNKDGICRVVKKSSTGSTYECPKAAVEGTKATGWELSPITTPNDYNLKTEVWLSITVDQVD